MSRIALVTGGTRGLGLAIALALRDGGCRVAVTYHSDNVAARRLQDETGIDVFRWDVADAAACRDGAPVSGRPSARWISSSTMRASPPTPCSTRWTRNSGGA